MKPLPISDAGSLPNLDLSMVRALVALVSTRSVSRAAESLGQSQPQLSATLRRMRTLLDDPIVVRGGSGMVPTDRALALFEPGRRILADVQVMLTPPQSPTPGRIQGPIQIGAPDYLSADLFAAIVRELRLQAPEATVLIRPVRSEQEGASLLESGQVELLLESSVVPVANVRYSLLFTDNVMGVASQDHPLFARELSVADYLKCAHVAAAPASGLRPGLIDHLLSKQGLTRSIALRVPYLNSLAPILAGSNLVFTTTGNLATYLAQHSGLRLFLPPVSFPPVSFFLMWHERLHRSGQHRWLRRLLKEVIARET